MLNKLGASGLQSELSHPVGLLSHTLQVMEAAKGTRTGREWGDLGVSCYNRLVNI